MLIRELCDGPCEARIPFRPILLLQKRVGGLHRRDFGQSQLLDQAVLRSEKTPFNAALGLRRKRRDPTNAQLAQTPAELCQAIMSDALWRALVRAQRDGEHRVAV